MSFDFPDGLLLYNIYCCLLNQVFAVLTYFMISAPRLRLVLVKSNIRNMLKNIPHWFEVEISQRFFFVWISSFKIVRLGFKLSVNCAQMTIERNYVKDHQPNQEIATKKIVLVSV
jgi:hypothetical protein